MTEQQLKNILREQIKGFYYADIEGCVLWEVFEHWDEDSIRGWIEGDVESWYEFITSLGKGNVAFDFIEKEPLTLKNLEDHNFADNFKGSKTGFNTYLLYSYLVAGLKLNKQFIQPTIIGVDLASEPSKACVIIYGDDMAVTQVLGPFDDPSSAVEYADACHDGETYLITDLYKPTKEEN